MMTMVLPASVQIGPRVFSIVKKGVDEMSDKVGETHATRSQIDIREFLPPQVERATVLHECLHAIIAIFMQGMSGNVAAWEKDEWEELVVSGLEPGMLMLLRDNPELVQYLTQ